MIEVNNIYMNIDNKEILRDISFKCENGRILGLIGPNGVGKTTLIKCLTGIYKPQSGSILYNNSQVFDNDKTKELIGYVQDESTFFSNYKINDIKKYYKLAYKNFDEIKFNKINNMFNIPLNKKMFQLSKGIKMLVNILFAFSINAKYLILDEPTAGLDVIFKKKFLKLLREEVLKNKITVVISSHHLNELENICDDILIINNGKVVFNDSINNLNNKVKKIQVAFDIPVYEEDFAEFNEILALSKTGRVFTIITKNYNDEFLFKLNKLEPLFIEEISLTLEDMFIYHIEKGDINEKYN
ncbi:ABC-2 type transport system ATP-binding protein [Clostridium moniliforme]|uniref:ABC-2 type transport system ATP-binding protein n=1 Tax=Clostridium moniliforme TaxID=39489 RepID=A0ABS4F0Y5_9CLOT|nr:ABC transporter ATP-binding protein [Clostridium moniliforme]MBP1889918.1 ABC-2 type transport system ATP-binding protein [Clostridium moniliforme]